MPTELTAYTVRNGGDKLSAETEIAAQLPGKLFGRVLRTRQVPLKLVDKRDVTDVDVQLQEGKVKEKGRVKMFDGVSTTLLETENSASIHVWWGRWVVTICFLATVHKCRGEFKTSSQEVNSYR